MRRLTNLVWAGCMLACASSVHAELRSADAVPGASLLLPYFEVDTAAASGKTTLFSINNVQKDATVVRVTLWTDLGVPTLKFHVYLTGYDVQTIDLRDIFAGTLPRTATDGGDLADTAARGDGISDQGPWSQDINYAACNAELPPAIPAITGTALSDLIAKHTGATTSDNKCAALDRGDGLARGYITVDNMANCDLKSPWEAGFDNGHLRHYNQLWGDFQLVEADGRRYGAQMASLEADNSGYYQNGWATFYGAHLGYNTGDDREALPGAWAVPFTMNATELLVWRDPKTASAPFACGATPGWYPLGTVELLAFDMQEEPTALTGNPFTAATQRVSLSATSGSGRLAVPSKSGWALFNLNAADNSSPWALGTDQRQAYVVSLSTKDPISRPGMSNASGAVQMDVSTHLHPVINNP